MEGPHFGAPIQFAQPPASQPLMAQQWAAQPQPQPSQHWDACSAGWAAPLPAYPPPPPPPGGSHTPPPVFYTEAQLTLDSGSPSQGESRWSPGSITGGGGAASAPAPPAAGPSPYASHTPLPPQQQQQLAALEARNAELLRHCQELQARLEAAAAERQASPPAPASTHKPSPVADAADPAELAALQRRLAAKAREAAAAAQAAEAAATALKAKEADLEGERSKAAALADEKDREARALAQRLEAATAHGGLLDDSVAALKRQVQELSTAVAQRDVAIRQAEDRLRGLQGSEGSKERQLEALQAELEVTRGERDALRRECAALRQQAGELDAEVRRLGAALQQAAKEQAAALRLHSRDLELITAVPPPQQPPAAGGAGAVPVQAAACSASPQSPVGYYGVPVSSPHPSQQPYSQPQFGGYAGPQPGAHRYSAADQPAAGFDWAASSQLAGHDPYGSQRPYTAQPPASQQLHGWQEAAAGGDVRASYAATGGHFSGAFHSHNRPAALATSQSYAPSVSAYNDCSPSGHGGAPAALRPSPPPHHAWEACSQGSRGPAAASGGADTPTSLYHQQRLLQRGAGEEEGLAGQLEALALHRTPTAAASSPFATEDTLQDMLARTQALEERLLQLNAERNELEAEAARMPSHTTGRTVQERRRRGEVEARLEAINKESSALRLQLRRLGVK